MNPPSRLNRGYFWGLENGLGDSWLGWGGELCDDEGYLGAFFALIRKYKLPGGTAERDLGDGGLGDHVFSSSFLVNHLVEGGFGDSGGDLSHDVDADNRMPFLTIEVQDDEARSEELDALADYSRWEFEVLEDEADIGFEHGR
jgi:hypothetical protein